MQLFVLAGLFHGDNSSFGTGELEVACMVVSVVLRCFMVDMGATGWAVLCSFSSVCSSTAMVSMKALSMIFLGGGGSLCPCQP